jgi:hypothetical protein
LWLWTDPSLAGVRGRMRAALADALAALPTAKVERIAALAEASEPGAALRLSARLLREPASGWQQARDLAACALLLAVLEHLDERAALEFALLAHLRAGGVPRHDDRYTYPPPLDRPRLLRVRLRRQGWLALSVVASNTVGWSGIVRDLGSLSGGDPLGHLDGRGQPRRGWDL